MEKVIAYIRVSTDEQVKHGQGLDIQKEEIKEHVDKNNLDLIKIFEDQGESGANDINKRDGLNKMLEFVKQNNIKQVLITKFDRLARDIYIQLWVEKELKKYEVEITSINEKSLNGNDHMTKAMRHLAGVFAELEKNRIADRLKRGRKRKAKQGNKASGNCPLGYKYKDKKVVIDEETAPIIKEIFSQYLKKKSIAKVKKYLDNKGYKTKRDKEFSRYRINNILRNDFYKGVVTFDDVKKEGNHEPIINKITFGKVQAQLDRNKKTQ